jgi:hypothetical protein
MNVLVACECSDTVTDALKAVGVNAHSCDLKPSEHNRPDHIQADCRTLDYSGIDLVIAHPDCTFLANSGVRWMYSGGKILLSRMEKAWEAADFFNWCLNLPVPMICVENPIQHKYARQFIRKYNQIIQPWQFGDNESKATCLWLKGLPLLKATHEKPEYIKQSTWRQPPSDHRKADRARTFPGIAKAMAEQWGKIK